MKILGFVFLGLAVILVILSFVFMGDTYGNTEYVTMHTSLPIAAAFLLGAGGGLYLAGYNIERREKRERRRRGVDTRNKI